MPLALAQKETDLQVVKVITDSVTKRHLENLGLLQGSTVQVISENGGDVIIKVKDGRLAINKDLARKIMVA